jgi:hypothetical protein
MKLLYTSLKGNFSFHPKLQGGFFDAVVTHNRRRRVPGKRFHSPEFQVSF